MAVTQSHFRFGIDHLTESTHGWYAPEDVSPAPGALPLNKTFLLRFTLQCDATLQSDVDAEFQYRKNGGTWTQITTSSSDVKAVNAVAFLDAANTTQRLSGTGTFETTSQGCTTDGIAGGTAFDIIANGNGEVECALQLVGPDLVTGDLIEFRLTRDGGVLIDTYAVNPSLTVQVPVFSRYTRTGPFPFPRERPDFFPSIAAAYAALTGAESVLSVGSMLMAVTIALTGIGATGAAGTLNPTNNITLALTGVSSTMGQGTVAPDSQSAISGVQSLGDVGTMSGGVWFIERPRLISGPFPFPKEKPAFAVTAGPVSLLGQEITTSPGTPAPASTVATSGVASTGSPGTISADRAIPLTGVSSTGSPGFLAVPGGAGLTGHLATGAIGTLAPSVAPALVGIPSTLSPGTIAADQSLPITGQEITSGQGNIARAGGVFPIGIPLTGVQSNTAIGNLFAGTPGFGDLGGQVTTGAAGTVGPVITLALTGLSATGQLGTVVATRFVIDRPHSITGPFPFLAAGMFQFRQKARVVSPQSQSITIQLIGLSSSGATGQVAVDRQAFALGQVVITAPGTLVPTVTITSSGVSATSAIGSITLAATAALSGQVITAAQGTETPVISTTPTGQSVTGAVGTFGFAQALAGETLFADAGLLSPVVTIALVGNQAAISINSLSANANADVTTGLTGVSSTGSQGTLAPSSTIATTGIPSTGSPGQFVATIATPAVSVVATSALGAVSPIIATAPSGFSITTSLGSAGIGQTLTGQATTLAQGSVSPGRTIALVGISITPSISSLGAQSNQNVTVGLTGLSSTIGLGTVVAGLSNSLSGIPSFGSVGILGKGQALTGVSGAVSRGSVGPVVSIQLIGQAVVPAIQSLVAQAGTGGTVGLATVPIVTGQGTLSPIVTRDLTGNSVIATSAIGDVAPTVAVDVQSTPITASLGAVSASGSGQATLAGLQAIVSLGDIDTITGPTLSGFESVGHAGQMTTSRTIQLVGVSTAVVHGNLHIEGPVTIRLRGTSTTRIRLRGTNG